MADRNPRSHEDAKRMQKAATESRNELRAEKARTEGLDPGRDTSALNVAKARAERWSTTSGPSHTK
jgi:hypothetical protein